VSLRTPSVASPAYWLAQHALHEYVPGVASVAPRSASCCLVVIRHLPYLRSRGSLFRGRRTSQLSSFVMALGHPEACISFSFCLHCRGSLPRFPLSGVATLLTPSVAASFHLLALHALHQHLLAPPWPFVSGRTPHDVIQGKDRLKTSSGPRRSRLPHY
jgi:hypothetical protein